MSETLEKLLNNFIESKHSEIKENTEKDEYMEYMTTAVKEKMRAAVVEEIRREIEPEIVQKVKKDNEIEEQKRKVKELQEVLWSGFIIAFIVGLLVNQVTDIISFLKGASGIESISSTILICIGLLAVCIIAYGWLFITKVLEFIHELKK